MIKYILCYHLHTIEVIDSGIDYYAQFDTINNLFNHYKSILSGKYSGQYKVALIKENSCVGFLSLKKYINLL